MSSGPSFKPGVSSARVSNMSPLERKHLHVGSVQWRNRMNRFSERDQQHQQVKQVPQVQSVKQNKSNKPPIKRQTKHLPSQANSSHLLSLVSLFCATSRLCQWVPSASSCGNSSQNSNFRTLKPWTPQPEPQRHPWANTICFGQTCGWPTKVPGGRPGKWEYQPILVVVEVPRNESWNQQDGRTIQQIVLLFEQQSVGL